MFRKNCTNDVGADDMRKNIKIRKIISYFYIFANESWKICEANFTGESVHKRLF